MGEGGLCVAVLPAAAGRPAVSTSLSNLVSFGKLAKTPAWSGSGHTRSGKPTKHRYGDVWLNIGDLRQVRAPEAGTTAPPSFGAT